MKVVDRIAPKSGTWLWGLLAVASIAASCSTSGSDDASGFRNTPGANNGSGGSSSSINTGSGGNTSEPPPLPPEKEKDSSFKLPVRSARWIWAANPLSDRVSVIDTHDLSVRLAVAGFGPTYLAPLGVNGDVQSAAIVLNAKSNNATVMRLRNDQLETQTLGTHSGANSWAVSASGSWAIAWTDANGVNAADPADSFQDITIIDASLPRATATRASVGYRPSRIFFSQDEQRAFVVSEASLSIIDLSHDGPSVVQDVALGAGREKAIDVSVLPDGSYALFRVEGSSKVSIVALASGERSDITLSGPVTDLDLVADGTSAIAVVRGRPVTANAASGGASSTGGAASANGGGANGGELGAMNGGAGGAAGAFGQSGADSGGTSGGEATGSGETDAGAGGVAGVSGQGTPPASGYGPSEVAVLTLPAVLHAPSEFSRVLVPELVGSVAVSSDGAEAVLYTTASALDRVTVLPTDTSVADFLTPRSVYVHAPVDAVFISPDHAHALVTLRAPQGMTGVGFGIVPLTEALPAQVRATSAPITSAAFSDAPTTSAILTSASGLTAYLVRMPALRVDAVPLLNLPLAAGVVPEEGVGYVVQQHPDGQLSLIDLDDGELRTLTGFELSRGVTNGQ